MERHNTRSTAGAGSENGSAQVDIEELFFPVSRRSHGPTFRQKLLRLQPLQHPGFIFRALLQRDKTFGADGPASSADADAAYAAYEACFAACVPAATELDLSHAGWAAPEAEALAALLPCYEGVRRLDLSGNRLGERAL